MPYKRKDSPIWWVSFTEPRGERVRKSTGTTDRKEAEALEAKWRLEAYKVKKWGEEPAHTFEELMIAYLKARDGEIKLPPVVHAIKHLSRMFAGRTMETLKRSDIMAYIAMRKDEGVGPATINRELDVLSASINYAIRRWDWGLGNPVAGMSLKQPEGRLRWITRAEVEALIRLAEQDWKTVHLADFIRLAVNTGCRKGELLGLEWSRVNLHDRHIRLDGNHTKSGKRRFVPLAEEARQALLNRARFRAEHCPASPWVFAHKDGSRIEAVHHGFSSLCKRAGITDFRIHDLRHTCASWLVSAGIPLREVQELLGHGSIQMTERYAHLAPENLRASVMALDRLKSRSSHAGNAEGMRDVG